MVSGEGGRPFGLERYGKALYVAWYYKHRVALGDPKATIRGLAAKEGITGRFADHIWSVVNKPNTAYPTRETVERWTRLPAPTADIPASVEQGAPAATNSAFLNRPAVLRARRSAAGGAAREPLAFTAKTLKVDPPAASRMGQRAGRPGPVRPSTPGQQKSTDFQRRRYRSSRTR